jgi:hypothetical protein
VRAIASGDEVAVDFAGPARMPVVDFWLVALETFDTNVVNLEQDLTTRCDPSLNQIFDDFMLAVHGNRASGEILEIDAVALSSETQFDAVVNQTLALHSFGHAHLDEQIDGSGFENAGTDALLAILARPVFENNGLDALEMKEVRKDEACRPGSDDSHLRAHRAHSGNPE